MASGPWRRGDFANQISGTASPASNGIRRVDLADAAIEAALAAAWLGAGRAIGEAPGRAAAEEGAVEALAREERAGARRVPFDAGDAVPEI